jgi:hypothetical protein
MKFILLSLLAALPLAAQTNTPSSSASPLSPTNSPPDGETVVHAPAIPRVPAERPVPVDANGMPAAPPTFSPDPFSEGLIVQIVARYEKAWGGDKKETKALTGDLERWTKDEPNNYLLLAYLGSAYALDSRDALWPPAKLDFLKKGSKALDDAVTGDATNPGPRLLRAMNYYELPAMFGKHQAAHGDFQYLLQQMKGVLPMPYSLSLETKQAIYYYAGLSDAQFEDTAGAKDCWTKGLALAPTSKLGMKCKAELDKLK